jgi:hypothetical protein
MFKRACAALAATAIALVGFAPSANADPKADVIPVTCNGQLVQVAVNGNGDFTPGHLVGSTAVAVVLSIDATFTFTTTEGQHFSEHVVRSKGNVRGDTMTCTFSLSGTEPEGTFTASGTVVVFLTPRR